MRPENLPRIAARVTHVPGDLGPGLAALADALLRTTADPALDDAFRIAHNFNLVDAQIQTRRRALEQAAGTLREQLASIMAQLGEAA
jgi:hypothetical protein